MATFGLWERSEKVCSNQGKWFRGSAGQLFPPWLVLVQLVPLACQEAGDVSYDVSIHPGPKIALNDSSSVKMAALPGEVGELLGSCLMSLRILDLQ